MKKIVHIAIFLCVYGFVQAQPQENLSVSSIWRNNGDISNPLYYHLCDYAFKQLDEREAFINVLKTKTDWEKRQQDLKCLMKELVGEFPEKTPLNPVITSTIKKEGYTVEKLYFESLPRYYVTAALFLPSGKKEKLPAIVYCCGHYMEGIRNRAFQQEIINLVQKGFIVLAFDPIGQGERIQYFDSNNKSIFSPTQEHGYPGTQLLLAGRSPLLYFVWDGVRAIDYLQSRKEVDPARIRITGHSGGGTQSAFIAAMDDRVLAAAPHCYITSFNKMMRALGVVDAEQNPIYGLKNQPKTCSRCVETNGCRKTEKSGFQ